MAGSDGVCSTAIVTAGAAAAVSAPPRSQQHPKPPLGLAAGSGAASAAAEPASRAPASSGNVFAKIDSPEQWASADMAGLRSSSGVDLPSLSGPAAEPVFEPDLQSPRRTKSIGSVKEKVAGLASEFGVGSGSGLIAPIAMGTTCLRADEGADRA
ncbi:unnamed protein product, partial [Closterium sp. NIES-53]